MTITIGRRELLAALGGAAVTWPPCRRDEGAWFEAVEHVAETSPTSPT
jgi:hypothetical protein